MTTFVLYVGWLALAVWALGCVALVRNAYRNGELWELGSLIILTWPYFAVAWFWDEVQRGS